jgi:serine/threonine-protein phosphatase Stp1
MADSASVGGRLRWASAARSACGPYRAVNEDRVFEDPINGLWAVADGMGGHRGGEQAAEDVVAALAQMTRKASGYGRLVMLRETFEQVNTNLVRRRAGEPRAGLSGSTVVSLLAHDDHFACVWAGDSRAYLLRRGALSRLTRDHSVVQDLVDQGFLSEAERDGHHQAHVITRAIGASVELQLDQVFDKIHSGDVFLLCSDGLTSSVSDQEIAAQLSSGEPAAADRLLDLALSRFPKDNVSLVLISAS